MSHEREGVVVWFGRTTVVVASVVGVVRFVTVSRGLTDVNGVDVGLVDDSDEEVDDEIGTNED
jgi:hypothetical protein